MRRIHSLIAQSPCELQRGSQRFPQRHRLNEFESPAEAAAGFTKTATDQNLLFEKMLTQFGTSNLARL